MKRILLIISLFISILNINGQDDKEFDIIRAKHESYVRDTNIIDLIIKHAPSGSARAAGSGMSLDGNYIDWSGTLNKTAQINALNYPIFLGGYTSRATIVGSYASSKILLDSEKLIDFRAYGKKWLLKADHFYNETNGDTLIDVQSVRDLIEANKDVLPFNFQYAFSSSITDSRPGNGLFRFNNATLASVTEIYVDYYDLDTKSQNYFLESADTGTYLTVQSNTNNWALYQVYGFVDAGNYFKYNVAYQGHSGVISGVSAIDLEINNNTGGGGGVSDSSWYETNTILARIDSIEYASGSRMTDIPQNNIYMWDSINSYYTPHPIYQANSAYYGTTDPTGTIRLNYDFNLHATKLNGDTVKVDNITSKTIYLNIDNENIYSVAEDEHSITGDEVVVTSTGGLGLTSTNSDVDIYAGDQVKIISNSNTTVFDGDTTRMDGSGESDPITIKVGGISVGGSEVMDTTYSSKDVIEGTEVGFVKFTPDTNITSHVEGRISYDSARKQLVLDDDIGGKWNIGSELGDRFYNPTGTQIDDGMVVRLTGNYDAGNYIYSTVELAGNGSRDSTNVLGIATSNLPSLGYGRVTFSGRVNAIPTIGLTGEVFLGNAGEKIDTSPPPPAISVSLGYVPYSHATDGYIELNPREPKYNPAPTFTAAFEDADEIIENPGVGVYTLITNATNDLFVEQRNVGFIFQGDSISPKQDGNYTIFFSYAQNGEASQTDVYRTGTFIDGALQQYMPRTISGTNLGGVPFPTTRFISAGSWISFRTANTVTGARDCAFQNATITINFAE